MRERLRTESERGKGCLRKRVEETQEKKVLKLQNISFTADSANSISEHDAEYLKHLTSVKVVKTCAMKSR